METVTGKSGPRGEVGKGTAGKALKRRAKKEGFKGSLKDYAKNQPEVKAWTANKRGKLNKKRSDESVKRIALEKSASRLARKSKKASGKAKATDTATTDKK